MALFPKVKKNYTSSRLLYPHSNKLKIRKIFYNSSTREVFSFNLLELLLADYFVEDTDIVVFFFFTDIFCHQHWLLNLYLSW